MTLDWPRRAVYEARDSMEEHTTETYSEKSKVGLIAGDPLRVLGLKEILFEQCRLTGISLSIAGALHSFQLNLLLIDAGTVAEISSLLATLRRQRPDLRIVVLGPPADMEFVQLMIGAGAKGYLPHDAKEDEICQCMEVVRDGSIWAPRKVLARLIEAAETRASVSKIADSRFTGREDQVLKLLIEGRPNRDIALTLGIDEGTVKAHISRLMRKVGVGNRTALTMHVLNAQRAAQ